MSGVFSTIANFLTEPFKRVKNESLIALFGIVLFVVGAIIVLPRDLSNERYAVAIVAFLILVSMSVYVLRSLNVDRREFEERERDLNQKLIEERDRRESVRRCFEQEIEMCASETATTVIVFGTGLLQNEEPPEDKRAFVLGCLTSYFERQIDWHRGRGEERLANWFEMLVHHPKKELKLVEFSAVLGSQSDQAL